MIITDEKGYINVAIAFLIILLVFMMFIIYFDFLNDYNKSSIESISSTEFKNEIVSFKRDIPIIIRSSLIENSENIINTKIPFKDSAQELKQDIQLRLNEKSTIYKQSINSTVLSIENSEDPFFLIVKINLKAKSSNEEYYEEIIYQKIPIEGLKDPLPFLICKDYQGLTYNETKIHYKSSLSNFLMDRNIKNYDLYENASSPLIIKKCPYDPYKQHGYGITMKNCRDNGYYHESRDGACYLCRLEGKETCPHYGFETFISPRDIENYLNLSSACSSDHVIFSNNPYLGKICVYYNQTNNLKILCLDNGHSTKYGMI